MRIFDEKFYVLVVGSSSIKGFIDTDLSIGNNVLTSQYNESILKIFLKRKLWSNCIFAEIYSNS